MVLFLSAFISLNLFFGTQGRPRRLKLFYSERQAEDMAGVGGMSVLERPHWVLLGGVSRFSHVGL